MSRENIRRIKWKVVPYFMYVIKPVFGNLGAVRSVVELKEGKVYRLQSLVNSAFYFDFYEKELEEE